jgi:hypothetical protein
MNSPGSGSPDQSANKDDAVWLDLVARLEGNSPAGTPDAGNQDAHQDPGGTADAPGQHGPANPTGRPATFRDFDPLGLAGAAPTELSAAERLASAPGTAAGRDGEDGGHGQDQHAPGGPRDYGVAEDDGDFVPEDPPSLAGTDPLTMLAWLGAVGAPVALLLSTMFWRSAPLLAVLGMVAAFILAVVYLIMKLPQEKDENDDGARI